MYFPRINSLAAIVIHSSHLSDNALIHYTNKHIPPGYLCGTVGAEASRWTGGRNSRWCWLINWQVNFHVDNESKSQKDNRESLWPFALPCMQCHLSIAASTTSRNRYTLCQELVNCFHYLGYTFSRPFPIIIIT